MKYSALDIDRMRDAVRYLVAPAGVLGYFITEAAIDRTDRVVEMRLLTYMANETTADELEALVEECKEQERRDAEARFEAEAEQFELQFRQPIVLSAPKMLGRDVATRKRSLLRRWRWKRF